MPKYKQEEFYSLMEERHPDLELLEPFKDSSTPTKVRCRLCGWVSYKTRRELLHHGGRRCAVCDNKVVVEGINDMTTTSPEVAQYFTEEFAKTHTASSSLRGLGTCIECGFQKMITPYQVKSQGFSCNLCSDHVSYPNKIGRAFLLQLPIENMIPEYYPKWTKKKLFYDNYFEYKGQAYILEMDGGLGHGKMDYYHKANPESILKDREKERLAAEHSIKLIRIDCSKSDLDYIKNNILHSELANIFDLTKIDWIRCDKIAQKTLVKIACEAYEANPDKEFEEIAKLCNISYSCLQIYLSRGAKLGWCSYDITKSAKRSGIFKSIKTGTPVDVYDATTGEYIKSYTSMNFCMKDLGISSAGVISYHVRKGTPYLNYVFKKGG